LAQLLITIWFGLVFRFQAYETETEKNRLVFLNILISLISFFSYFFPLFSQFKWFFSFFLTPST
jgi:hypothetical protein